MDMTNEQATELQAKLSVYAEKANSIEFDENNTKSMKLFYKIVLDIVVDMIDEINEYEKVLVLAKIKEKLQKQ